MAPGHKKSVKYYSSSEVHGPLSAGRAAPSQEAVPATDSEYSLAIPHIPPRVNIATAVGATGLGRKKDATAVPIDDDVASIDESVVGGKDEAEVGGNRRRPTTTGRSVTGLQWGMLGCRIAEVILCIIAFA